MRRVTKIETTVNGKAACHLALVEECAPGVERTLSIKGPVANDAAPRGSTAIPSRTAFDDGGHLIAARFGGSMEAANLVPMHATINQSGWPYFRMESDVKRLLGNAEGRMSVEVHYHSPPPPFVGPPAPDGKAPPQRLDLDPLRPRQFLVELWVPGKGFTYWHIDNYAPYLEPASELPHVRERLRALLIKRNISISTKQRRAIYLELNVGQLQDWLRYAETAQSARQIFVRG